METKTVKELQAIAKQQKLRGYSRLRKAELITLLNEASQQLRGAIESQTVKKLQAIAKNTKNVEDTQGSERLS